jgi:hypothetical protein
LPQFSAVKAGQAARRTVQVRSFFKQDTIK